MKHTADNENDRRATAAAVRQRIRAGLIDGPTAGLAPGFAQANLVVLPRDWAEEFAEFCRLNPRPCPVLEQTSPGDPCPRQTAPGADLRTDVPRYRIFRDGQPEAEQPADISRLWRDDFVAFLLGCSFTFESALIEAGLPVRHIDQQRNVPMYATNVDCQPAGRFSGKLVVSMRPYRPEQIDAVVAITSEFPTMHGAPIHVGEPDKLGIADLNRPDFGEPVTVHAGETPLFWACGVTPQLALLSARPPIAITHSPGAMFITDRSDASYRHTTTERNASR